MRVHGEVLEEKLSHRSASRVFLLLLISGAYTVLLLWATSSAAPAVPAMPLRIGIILPLSGSTPDVANSALIGAKVAVEEINAVGGYMGRPLEMVVHDDQSNPELGYKLAQELVQHEGVVATVGVCNTAVGIRVAEVFQAHKHPFIVSCATGSSITTKYPPAASYIFRTSANSQIQAQFLVNELQKAKLHKIALLLDSTPFGDAGLNDLTVALAQSGLKPRAVVRFNLGVKNLDKEMLQLKASGADALVGWTLGAEQGVIAASRAAVRWQVPHYGEWDLSNASAYAVSNGRVDGAMMVQTVLPNRRLERNSAFISAYAKHSQEHPIGSMMSAAQTYDAVHLLVRAMFSTKGDFSGPAIKQALENMTEIYRGVVTSYDRPFSASDHEAIAINMLWLGTWRNGERAYYYDDDEKRAFVIRHKTH